MKRNSRFKPVIAILELQPDVTAWPNEPRHIVNVAHVSISPFSGSLLIGAAKPDCYSFGEELFTLSIPFADLKHFFQTKLPHPKDQQSKRAYKHQQIL